MTIEWIRRIRCAWRARRLLSNIALLTDAYCGLANRLDDGFNEDTFTDAYHMRHVIDTRLGELEAYLTAGTLPDRWHTGRRELVSDGLAAADELMDKARTRYNEMVLLEYEANGMDANLLEHARRIMASTDELLGGIEVMRPGEEQ